MDKENQTVNRRPEPARGLGRGRQSEKVAMASRFEFVSKDSCSMETTCPNETTVVDAIRVVPVVWNG
jgi:hypothetical protein